MTTQRYLIVNADDFGQSYGLNQGILGAHIRGVVTSTSLTVRWPAASETFLTSPPLPESTTVKISKGNLDWQDEEEPLGG